MTAAPIIPRSRLLQWLLVLLFPRLKAWPVCEWSDVLARCRAHELDRFERIGIIAAVVLVTWLLRPAANAVAPHWVFVTQLVLAIPLLFVFAGPFFLRRIRRGLDVAFRQLRDAGAVAAAQRN